MNIKIENTGLDPWYVYILGGQNGLITDIDYFRVSPVIVSRVRSNLAVISGLFTANTVIMNAADVNTLGGRVNSANCPGLDDICPRTVGTVTGPIPQQGKLAHW